MTHTESAVAAWRGRDAVDSEGGKIGSIDEIWLEENREVVKTRLLDLSAALHLEVDRPDAEATFRMALWPPPALLALYLAIFVSPFWLAALVLPLLLAWQWISLRRLANDALVTAIAARDELREPLEEWVRNRADTSSSP